MVSQELESCVISKISSIITGKASPKFLPYIAYLFSSSPAIIAAALQMLRLKKPFFYKSYQDINHKKY